MRAARCSAIRQMSAFVDHAVERRREHRASTTSPSRSRTRTAASWIRSTLELHERDRVVDLVGHACDEPAERSELVGAREMRLGREELRMRPREVGRALRRRAARGSR